MIRRLWLRPTTSLHVYRGFDLPFLVWVPLFCAVLVLRAIKRRSRDGEISPLVATNLSSGFALITLIAYLIITRFAQIAFR